MKIKLMSLVTVLAISGFLKAQTDCMQFFPNNIGAYMVSKTYDAKDSLISTMTYRVNQVYDYRDGLDMEMGYALADKTGNIISNGSLNATCQHGTFQMSMVSKAATPEAVEMFSTDTELVGDFLDYPNMKEDEAFYGSSFSMTGGEFTIKSKADEDAWIKLKVHNRKYVKNERITTPAKDTPFRAAKVTFDFEVTKNGETTQYKGIEWYALNAGVIRSETYDSNDNLINYTVLTELDDKIKRDDL